MTGLGVCLAIGYAGMPLPLPTAPGIGIPLPLPIAFGGIPLPLVVCYPKGTSLAAGFGAFALMKSYVHTSLIYIYCDLIIFLVSVYLVPLSFKWSALAMSLYSLVLQSEPVTLKSSFSI